MRKGGVLDLRKAAAIMSDLIAIGLPFPGPNRGSAIRDLPRGGHRSRPARAYAAVDPRAGDGVEAQGAHRGGAGVGSSFESNAALS